MIKLDFYWAISAFTLIVTAAFISLIYYENLKKPAFKIEKRFVWHCLICAYTYISVKDEVISKCPRCSNYNKKEAGA